jgi:20S proteasome alpha/beta subunit
MTAIIGFTCHDSVLMMADTKETTNYAHYYELPA